MNLKQVYKKHEGLSAEEIVDRMQPQFWEDLVKDEDLPKYMCGYCMKIGNDEICSNHLDKKKGETWQELHELYWWASKSKINPDQVIEHVIKVVN